MFNCLCSWLVQFLPLDFCLRSPRFFSGVFGVSLSLSQNSARGRRRRHTGARLHPPSTVRSDRCTFSVAYGERSEVPVGRRPFQHLLARLRELTLAYRLESPSAHAVVLTRLEVHRVRREITR